MAAALPEAWLRGPVPGVPTPLQPVAHALMQALEESVNVARDLFNKPIVEEFARVEYVDVLLATRDLLEARTDLIETKQQQLSAMVNAYRALGGGYLLTSTGPEMADVLCAPWGMEWEIPIREEVSAPPPGNAAPQPGPQMDSLPPPQNPAVQP